jgi:hypothetical protein
MSSLKCFFCNSNNSFDCHGSSGCYLGPIYTFTRIYKYTGE